jgi:hypothetical protein
MSWLFSRALVEEFSAGTCSDGEPSAQLNVMPTQHKFWRSDKTMEPSDLSRFGLTCAVLTEGRGAELLMWYRAGFPARTSVQLALALASMAQRAAYGERWLASLAKFDRDTSSWRTPQCLLFEGSESSLETWPRSGSMRSGTCYRRPTLAPNTSENASGLWPTPTASLGTKGGRVTPRKGRHGGTLIEAVSLRRYPTPIANDAQKRGDLRSSPQYLAGAAQVLDSEVGPLNPPWVEWLMGWLIGWTDLQPLATAKFHEWQQQHSPHSLQSLSEPA